MSFAENASRLMEALSGQRGFVVLGISSRVYSP